MVLIRADTYNYRDSDQSLCVGIISDSLSTQQNIFKGFF